MALSGTFGYELDITKIAEAERNMIPEQTQMYHKYHDLIREGDYFRIASYRENHLYDCWASAAKDRSEVLVTYVQVLGQANVHSRRIYLDGFDPDKTYRLEGTDEVYTGEMLMCMGFLMRDFRGDFRSRLYHSQQNKVKTTQELSSCVIIFYRFFCGYPAFSDPVRR